nr:hypothetical protein CFP56_69269 [Quercus suber]
MTAAELSSSFTELKKLKFLWITASNLNEEIPDTIGEMEALVHLNLSINNLTEIGEKARQSESSKEQFTFPILFPNSEQWTQKRCGRTNKMPLPQDKSRMRGCSKKA